MAPSVGHLHKLVARNHKLLKAAWNKASHLLNTRIPFSLRIVQGNLQPVYIEATASAHPVHHIAALRRRAVNSTRNYTTSTQTSSRASYPKSRTATAVNSLTGRAPFASTLRPNLTGGTLGRTSGGYGFGSGRLGGARYFSHTPSAPAEVIRNVSQAVRAFCLNGHKAQYSGTSQRGNKQYRTVSTLQDETHRRVVSVPKATPGSYIDFAVNPTITALTPLAAIAGFSSSPDNTESAMPSLKTEGLLDILSADFSRALKDLAAVLNDLTRLADLGDLPITYAASESCLRVHFPGCDAGSVERLCAELDVKRGVVHEDASFAAFAGTEIALLFPFAPSRVPSEDMPIFSPVKEQEIDWREMMPADKYSTQSETSAFELFDRPVEKVSSDWSPEGYESLRSPSHAQASVLSSDPLEYHDFEGIYRFIEMCDGARR